MAGNDLSTPLGLSNKKKYLNLPLGLIGAGMITLLALTALVWIGVVDDPLGGEPTASIPLERSLDGLTARDFGVVEIRPTLPEQGEPGSQADGGRDETLGPRFEPKPAGEQDLAAQPEDDMPSLASGQGLSERPDARVSESGPHGRLPTVSDNGLRPLDIYARPVSQSFASVPKIAIIVGGLGLSQTSTQAAIDRLPPDITLAFAPYGSSIDRWMQQARRAGHELLLQLPMEPFDYPDNDPGPHTLLVSNTPVELRDRLSWLLSRITNYVGVMNYMGARFTASESSLQQLLGEVTQRGLMYVDDGSSSRSIATATASGLRTPFSHADLVIDDVPRPKDITARLLQLEGTARARGIAVGVASALPVTIEELARWSRDLEERGLQLIPISASIDRAGQ
ncbi:divergent polysaccharide deacetylase family protein [Stappia indica]|uniref:Divergent polysaccharide deacetylase family protein n=1 Tax=Stappia indica TaxID=538381 RepID=A0A857CA03_9HYPH|nr:divergent polysaccharide deacetylase family protein [Stappia indica]QGZ35853.1 divergent polysaccharide deacetylase family protein [Stappia indica]